MHFTEILRDLLQVKGLSGAQLAKLLNVSRPSTHAILRGKSLPKKERVVEIADVLDLAEEERRNLLDSYELVKNNSSILRVKPAKELLEKVKDLFRESGCHAGQPYTGWDDPDLFFECGGEKVGVLIGVQKWDWDTVLGFCLRAKFGHKLDQFIFICTPQSGMNTSFLNQALFEHYNVLPVSLEDLEVFLPENFVQI